jgi:DnaJ-class molecular chaperone
VGVVVSTADLIAELRRAADKKRADLALQSAALFTRAADALEAATKPPETATCLECEGEGHFTVTFVFGDRRVACDVCDGTGRVAVGGTE